MCSNEFVYNWFALHNMWYQVKFTAASRLVGGFPLYFICLQLALNLKETNVTNFN